LVAPILLAFVLPWIAFQKFVDPPGNRLIKWHLAGATDIDSRTPVEAIRQAYSSRSFSEIAALRWSNIKVLAGYKPFGMVGTFGLQDLSFRNGVEINQPASESSRAAQRDVLWNALGLLNFGWIAGAFLLFKKRRDSRLPYSSWLIPAVAMNILFWCLLEFGPQYTIITTCSFADFLMLSTGLLGFILELPNILFFAILAVQLFNFFVVWVCCPPYALNTWAGTVYTVSVQLPLIVFGAVLSLLILSHLCRKVSSSVAFRTASEDDSSNSQGHCSGAATATH